MKAQVDRVIEAWHSGSFKALDAAMMELELCQKQMHALEKRDKARALNGRRHIHHLIQLKEAGE